MTGVPFPLPDPPLGDGMLTLRSWRDADALRLAAAWADPEIARWTGVPSRRDVGAAAHWIAGDSDRRARGLALDLVIDIGGVVSGEVGMAHIDLAARTAEIGWWVAPEHRGQGVAGKAVGVFSQWVLSELFLENLTAMCHPENPASAAVARRAGFVFDAVVDDIELWRCC